jgi:hypothetical protein
MGSTVAVVGRTWMLELVCVMRYTVGTEHQHCQGVADMSSVTASIRDNEDVPVTKLRNLRVDEDLWVEAQRIAKERRETLSAVMKRALVEYVEKHGGSVQR